MHLPSKPPNYSLNYSWEVAGRDLTAGATVAAIAIPQAIAYALIAGVDPRFGLYSAIIVTIVASILGSSSHLINGPTNAVSLVVFSSLASFDPRHEAFEAMFLLGIIAGTIQILIALFKLGDLTRYVSESVVLGFMAGASLLIAIGQLGNFVGAGSKGTSDQSVLVRTWETLVYGGFNIKALGLGVATLVVVILLRLAINRYKLPRIDMLGGLLLASFVAAYFGWSIPAGSGKTAIAVIGTVPAALPSFAIPDAQLSWFPRIFTSSLAIAFLGLLEALAVAKSISTYTREPLDYNKQCMAEGVGNVIGGFFRCMPGSGSLTRSAINFQSGAITRLSGVYSGIMVAIVVYFFGPYARFIPKAALAGLLLITAARLIDWRRLFYALRTSRFDAALVLVTAFAAVFISVEDSILWGVGLSIVLFVPRASKLSVCELIVTPERVIRERQPGDARSKSLLIYDFEGDLFFGAASDLSRHLGLIQKEAIINGSKCVVLRLRRTRNPDVVAIEHLERFLQDTEKMGVVVLLAGLRPDLLKVLANLNFKDWLPEEHLFPEEGQVFSATLKAVRYGIHLISIESGEAGLSEKDPIYYLV